MENIFQVQFLIVFVHTIQIQFQPNCGYSKGIGSLLTLNAGLFTYMFSSFYIKTYLRRNKMKTTVESEKKKEDIVENIEKKDNISSNNNEPLKDLNFNHMNGQGYLKLRSF